MLLRTEMTDMGDVASKDIVRRILDTGCWKLTAMHLHNYQISTSFQQKAKTKNNLFVIQHNTNQL